MCVKTRPLSMSISGPVNMFLYRHQHHGFQNDFLYTPIFGYRKTPLCVWTCEDILEAHLRFSKYVPSLNAYINVSVDIPLCMPISGSQKCCSLYAYTILCKDAPSQYAYISTLKHKPLCMHTLVS
jgi:hypothetical protein